jgi:hypothetical protein
VTIIIIIIIILINNNNNNKIKVPVSMRPVATVPRPEMEKVSSTGIRNGFSTSRTGVGIDLSTCHYFAKKKKVKTSLLL